MSNVFDAIAGRDRNLSAVMATIVDGAAMGEKAFINGGKIVWMAEAAQGIPRHLDEIGAVRSCKILETAQGRIFCERIRSEKQLVICGAGHVSMPIIKMGKMLGFSVTVIDDRPRFADDARRAQAERVICDGFEAALKAIPGSPDTYFVVVTRGHRYDAECLKEILKKPYAYLGMMGSRRRVAIVRQDLKEEGFLPEAVDQIYAPIGLGIAAETPEEIAVSVMAEIIQVKNSEKGNDSCTRELLSALSSQNEDKRERVLATIISRRGSAPRQAGTKMIIYEDGQTLGTIGGGCVEADVIRQARWMMHKEAQEPQKLITVDMTEDQAAEAGMVCGGTVEIFMERITCQN